MPRPYQAAGFRLDGPLESGDVTYYTAAAVTILKGQAIHDDGSGLATNAVTALAATFLGIALEDCASGGSCAVIKPTLKNSFWVPNASVTVAAATDVGELVDLEAAGSIDVTDNTLVAWGFRVEAIDISAAALSANAGGYVKGCFAPQPQ